MSDITAKSYRKLALRAGVNGFSFAVTDMLSREVVALQQVDFGDHPDDGNVETRYREALARHIELSERYDEVAVLHDNPLNTFVPAPLFDVEASAGYLQYGTRVFATDTFAHDLLPQQDMVNVYIPYANINNALIDQFGTFDYRHSASVLVPKLLESGKYSWSPQVYAHFSAATVEIVVTRNGQLQFYNAFDCSAPSGFVYHLLFTAEQLALNPEEFRLQLLGAVTEDSDYFRMAYRYVRHVSLLETDGLLSTTTRPADDLQRHFILLNA